MATLYARLINQYKFKYQTIFSARFDKQVEDNQVSDEKELLNNLNINCNSTETDINKIEGKSSLEHQTQQQEMKSSGWNFDKVNSMILYFYKTGKMNGSSYIKNPLRPAAILNIENDVNYCFIWSILAKLHLCNTNHPNTVSNYKQYFNELNIQGFDFTNGFKCSDVHRFNESNNLSLNIIELDFDQDQNKWKHNLVPIEISKNKSDRVIDILIYKNYYALNKKLNVFLGNHNCTYVCKQCLNSLTSQNVLIKHKRQCGEQDIPSLGIINEYHLYWNKHFHKNPLYFRIYADFETDYEKDKSSISIRTTNVY